MSQIPAGAEGTVAGVMLYCCLCLIASLLLVWLTWTHHERTSYVAILSYFATLSTTASLVQQVYDITRYHGLVEEQFENRKMHPHNPEVAIANGSVGVSLVLYYIQYYCYGVEAMAASLAQSVYGLSSRPKLKNILRRINRGGKLAAILFPLVTTLLLRVPQVQDKFVSFILLADLPLMLSLFFGCILMIAILGRYIHTKRKFVHWSHDEASSTGHDLSALGGGRGTASTARPRHKRKGIWDRWLMVRFTIAFGALSVFEVTNTLFQLRSVTNAQDDSAARAPDLSAEKVRGSWVFFMPGATPGLLMFVVFGTTAPLRRHMYETFVPRRWRRQQQEGRESPPDPAVPLERRWSERAPTPPPKDWPVFVEVRRLPVQDKMGGSRRPGSDEAPILAVKRHEERHGGRGWGGKHTCNDRRA
ncbi:uncharacterized protein F5Z01DRAFT_672154 [Emericellopsis atlantica]|uniref:Glycoside hydrolase n=1 Tax=Emericellopsis atlantica TaxID=2614577 RepID=A0A9P7ZRE5_9HYPO|nr:uncharacterized protein F5Z01DRAFT_672154 [Emericellopsis atlantica]KAG9256929.1 hypothetical protein F5Z01DRAFT_672154 [Emericellopsis atlantica]